MNLAISKSWWQASYDAQPAPERVWPAGRLGPRKGTLTHAHACWALYRLLSGRLRP